MNKLIILKALLEGKHPLQVLIEMKELDESFADWAKNEVKVAGLHDEDSDYEGMIGRALEELIDVFSKQGHSGTSANIVSEIFHKLVQWEPLTTCDHQDYRDVSEMNVEKKPLLQCNRCYHMFSKDGGKSWYDIREK